MPKYNIGFTLTSTGHVTIEAESEEKAEDQAQQLLEHYVNSNQLRGSAPALATIRIDDNEVETW